jgi:ESS family glutamate:Na+ symporter
MILTQAQTLVLAMGVFFVGVFTHSHFRFFKKYNIPEPVIGGLLFSLLMTALYKFYSIDFVLDQEIQSDLMLTFFATVGLNAKFSLFKKGGKKLLIFLGVAVLYLFIQNIIGVGLATVLGLNPLIGLLAGSITLSGGHATGASYALKFSEIGGGIEIAVACATLGLVLGGMIGGPVSQYLIAKHKLAPDEKVLDPDDALKEHGFNEPEVVTTTSVLQTLICAFFCIFIGQKSSVFFQDSALHVPDFILVLFAGIIITNILDLTKNYSIKQQSLDLVNMTSLTLFLSLAMMSLKLLQLVHLALPILLIVGVQAIVIALYSSFVTFRALGKDYEAAAIAGGHCGFGLGATPTAVANIESITNRYGPAPHAMFIVLMIGAFFIDIANAVVIQIFLQLFS